MAQRDQVGGAFGRHDPGNPRRGDHVAFGNRPFGDGRTGVRVHRDAATGDGDTVGGGFCADIHHARLAMFVEMRQLGHVCAHARASHGFTDLLCPDLVCQGLL